MYSTSPKAKRLEFRAPDPSANPYLTFAALLMAGLDGIKTKSEPHASRWMWTCMIWSRKQRQDSIKNTPGSLLESLQALEADHAFLLRAACSRQDLLRHLAHDEAGQGRGRGGVAPHPYEYFLYYGRVTERAVRRRTRAGEGGFLLRPRPPSTAFARL